MRSSVWASALSALLCGQIEGKQPLLGENLNSVVWLVESAGKPIVGGPPDLVAPQELIQSANGFLDGFREDALTDLGVLSGGQKIIEEGKSILDGSANLLMGGNLVNEVVNNGGEMVYRPWSEAKGDTPQSYRENFGKYVESIQHSLLSQTNLPTYSSVPLPLLLDTSKKEIRTRSADTRAAHNVIHNSGVTPKTQEAHPTRHLNRQGAKLMIQNAARHAVEAAMENVEMREQYAVNVVQNIDDFRPSKIILGGGLTSGSTKKADKGSAKVYIGRVSDGSSGKSKPMPKYPDGKETSLKRKVEKNTQHGQRYPNTENSDAIYNYFASQEVNDSLLPSLSILDTPNILPQNVMNNITQLSKPARNSNRQRTFPKEEYRQIYTVGLPLSSPPPQYGSPYLAHPSVQAGENAEQVRSKGKKTAKKVVKKGIKKLAPGEALLFTEAFKEEAADLFQDFLILEGTAILAAANGFSNGARGFAEGTLNGLAYGERIAARRAAERFGV